MMQVHPIAAGSPALVAALLAAQLPTEDLADSGRTFLAFERDGRPVGYAGLELYGDFVLLRSMVVLPELRGQGLGRAITAQALARAYAVGARTAYLLTNTAEAFFERAGFVRIERRDAPAAILATRQATTICSTAALMARSIDPHG